MSPADQAERDKAVFERKKNVLIDAGAGTGKTTIIVSRFLELLAPRDGSPGVPIERLVAVTFTRKAAGELRLRIREALLKALADPGPSAARRGLLHTALGGLDTAWLGTIHSFADRLLRQFPVEARLSPAYEILEDSSELERETFTALLQAAEAGTLHALLAGKVSAARAAEAQSALLDAVASGIRVVTREFEFYSWPGLDALVTAFIRQRDVPPPFDAAVPKLSVPDFRELVDEFLALAKQVSGSGVGARWLRRAVRDLKLLREEPSEVRILAGLLTLVRSEPKTVRLRTECDGHKGTYDTWMAWNGDARKSAPRPGSLRSELLEPFWGWLAHRLVRAWPVVIAAYEQLKSRRQVVDQVDLLLKLRDLLRDDPKARERAQALFSHLFVDEFQDTDPLQAEVLLFLCEQGAKAKGWKQVELAPGKLTVVGDPKQSIYRFRRADILMYDEVRAKLAEGPHVSARLSANFRSVPGLIEWFNSRFEQVLGSPPKPGVQFDPESGAVFHQPLHAGRSGATEPRVHLLPLLPKHGIRVTAADSRRVEAVALPHYLRWLVEQGGLKIEDPLTRQQRAVHYGDIAVLVHSTWSLGPLFNTLDLLGVPWSARGGKLFLQDALHQQFLLGLRALSDRDDGVAQASLLRPPFFALDLEDLALARADLATGARQERVEGAKSLVAELRKHRFERAPGETARDLLERTAFGRHVALGPNGRQRLDRLRELCLAFEQLAAEEGLDFDGATARVRGWVEEPGQLDPPHPVDSDAVQVLTIHQAKGLEYPVVVLWDAAARWPPRTVQIPWAVSRDGKQWSLALSELVWHEPSGVGLAGREAAYLAEEKKRVVYVAATRARELLVIPVAGDGFINGTLTHGAPPHLHAPMAPWVEGRKPKWAVGLEPAPTSVFTTADQLAADVDQAWTAAAAASGVPRLVPIGVAREADAVVAAADLDGETPEAGKSRPGRFGASFGLTVHRALQLVLEKSAPTPAAAVALAARQAGLEEHHAEAEADVQRTLAALSALGIPDTGELRLEYPVAGARGPQKLLVGFIDLLHAADQVTVIDFKTDAPPTGDVEQRYPEYAEQLRTYGALLEAAGVAQAAGLRRGLLFTADGQTRWISAASGAQQGAEEGRTGPEG